MDSESSVVGDMKVRGSRSLSHRLRSGLGRLNIVMEQHRLLLAAIGLLLGFAAMGLDYHLHPEARKFQSQAIEDLKSLPLPPGASDQDFSSGYQPKKGRASRTISGPAPKDLCRFYSDIMTAAGWQLIQEECFLSSQGHALITFRKGNITRTIFTGPQDVVSQKYIITSSWSDYPLRGNSTLSGK